MWIKTTDGVWANGKYIIRLWLEPPAPKYDRPKWALVAMDQFGYTMDLFHYANEDEARTSFDQWVYSFITVHD